MASKPTKYIDQHGDVLDDAQLANRVKTPCPECPFNRAVKPGALGGSSPETYIGQLQGPFAIACHMHIDFSDPDWHRGAQYTQTPQCAGAAVFRANLGLAERMPEAIERAEPDTETVFATRREFVEHHAPNNQALAELADEPGFADLCLDAQLRKWRRGQKP